MKTLIYRKSLSILIVIVMILVAVANNLVIQGYKGHSLLTQGSQASRVSGLGITRVGDGDILYLDKDVEDLSDGEAMSITLITGDTVSILKKDGRVSVTVNPVKSGRNFYVFPKSDTLYVIPEDVDLNRFDIELFNIKLLAEHINITRGRLPLIVKVRDTTPVDQVTRSIGRIAEEVDGLGYKSLEIINSIALRIPTQEKEEVFKFYEVLATDQRIEKVVLDRIYKVNSLGENIGVQLYESVLLVGAPNLWELGIDGSGYTIAILDTGIDPNHPDFYVDGESKIVAIESFVDWDFDGEPDESPIDGHGHGTHCAGIAAGVGGYLDFIKGVAPGANLMVGKVLSDLGYGHDSWIISGIEWAVENGADVISMSLGGSASISYDPLVAAVNWAVEQGVVVVIAAGNSGPGYFTVASPGVSPKAITVGAVDKTLNIASFSSRGPTPNATLKPDVVAPGVDIASSRAWRTYMGEPASIHHVYASGTSMATPHVAGLATLILQLLEKQGILEEITNRLGISRADVVKNIIISTAKDLGLDPFTQGAGFANALKLLYLLESRRLVIVNPARIDVVEFENVTKELSLTLYNPFDEEISVTIDVEFKPWVSLRDNVHDAVTVEPVEVTIPAHSYTTISVGIDFSQVPAGYHTAVLKIVSDGEEIGRALIGISKPQLLRISTLFDGESYPGLIFVYAVAFSPALNQQVSLSGYDWGWTAYGKGEVFLYPLYPDTIYLIEVASLEEPYIVYTVMATDSVTNVYSLEIDFVEIEPKYITVADNLAGYAFVSYGVHMIVNDISNNVVANIVDADGTFIYLYPGADNEIRYGLYVDSLEIPGYRVKLSTRYFGVKAEVRDIEDPSKPIWIFYRVYNAPENIVVQPTAANTIVYHVHSAISSSEVNGTSALTIFGGAVNIDGAMSSSVIHPSYTIYYIDINVGISSIRALNILTIPSEDKKDYLTITAYQLSGLRMDSMYLFAPLASPLAGSTIWSYSMLLRGLDLNNFTYSLGLGHTFRATFTKFYNIYSRLYPISYVLLKINDQQVVYTLDTYALTYYLEGFNWNNTKLARVQYQFTLDLSRYAILRVSNYAYSLATIQFAEPNYAAYEVVDAFGYGIGLRDVLAVGGFDYMYNYLPVGQQMYLYLFINRPADTNLGLVGRKVKLVGYANGVPTEIELPTTILGTTTAYYLAIAYVDASQILQYASPGAFDLVVELLYRHSLTGDEVAYYLYVSNAIYIGASVYVPPATPIPTPTPTETTPTETIPITTTVTVTQTVTSTKTTTTTVTMPTTVTTTIVPPPAIVTITIRVTDTVTSTVTRTYVLESPYTIVTTIRDTVTLLLTVTDIRTVSIPITIPYTYTITSPYTTTITTSIPTTIIRPTTVVQPTTLTTTIDRTRTIEIPVTTTETKLQTVEVERTSIIRETVRETVIRTLASTIIQPTTIVSTVYEAPGWVTPTVAILAIIAIGSIVIYIFRCRRL